MSVDDLDKCISVNNQIYFQIETMLTHKLNIAKVLANTTIIDNSKFDQLIESYDYRWDSFQTVLNFINTYKEHPSEEDLTLFLLGTTGKLLAEFLSEQGLVEYSREMNGYAVTFKNSHIASDYFIEDLVTFISQLGFASVPWP
ncbi:hypothetical protein [Paenibacillus pedocola]|uniref:hypothetical protein n=1 Tax=Paenibacillus pedocola TaxID=3242193 RepID=UPI00287752C2|nr:hypothetical protein [Paenibacillus typhae]